MKRSKKQQIKRKENQEKMRKYNRERANIFKVNTINNLSLELHQKVTKLCDEKGWRLHIVEAYINKWLYFPCKREVRPYRREAAELFKSILESKLKLMKAKAKKGETKTNEK